MRGRVRGAHSEAVVARRQLTMEERAEKNRTRVDESAHAEREDGDPLEDEAGTGRQVAVVRFSSTASLMAAVTITVVMASQAALDIGVAPSNLCGVAESSRGGCVFVSATRRHTYTIYQVARSDHMEAPISKL